LHANFKKMKFKLFIVSILIILNFQCINKKRDLYNSDESIIPVCYNNQWGFIKQDGDYLVYPKFQEVMTFTEGVAAVCLNEKWGYIDSTGNHIIRPVYDEVTIFSEGKAFVRGDSGEFLCINKKQDTLFTLYDAKICNVFSNGYAEVTFQEGIRYVDKSGKNTNIKTPAVSNNVKPQPKGLSLSKDKSGKYGYINEKGKYIIDPVYDAAGNFMGDLAYVKLNGKIGFINRKGDLLVEPRYEASYDDCKSVTSLMKDTLHLGVFVDNFLSNTVDGKFKGFSSNRTLENFLQNDIYRKEGSALILKSNTQLTEYAKLIMTQYNFSDNVSALNKKIEFNYEDGFNNTRDTLNVDYNNPKNVYLKGIEYMLKIEPNYADQINRIVKEFKLKLAEILTVSASRNNNEYVINGQKMKVSISVPSLNEENIILIKVDFFY